ncbi:MAG: heterodisulfide reductase-related iron-sulfur binding cluster [Cycloclasticus sp.]|jgi:Fe-S oxidoreductase|nr:heterodisulfide reductase-related iron-sulfur binding cluster [Cycloclasticus sp.]MEE4290617.1 heterodisulfide reductase-related iron-sulfur binding cluster [Cycloclasticus sp.]
MREGSLEAPTRHPLDWKNANFYDEANLFNELDRVFDICHGCRRCFNLCNAFPLLFDVIDESETMELDSVDKKVYWDVVDNCYLCDMCFMSKCPYVPPHEWDLDFPHLMLRAKAVKFKKDDVKKRDKLITSTDKVGKLASIPIVVNVVNAANKNTAVRKVLDSQLGIHQDAVIPAYHTETARKKFSKQSHAQPLVEACGETTGKVAIFTTCYGNYNRPDLVNDLVMVLEHNNVAVTMASQESCCGMPKLELGDLEEVERLKNNNIPQLVKLIDEGWDIIAPVPSCVLMFKQELPLMFPDDKDVAKVRDAMFDPFEYLMLRHKSALLNTDFKDELGTVSYQVACHLRVQNIGLKTKEVLELIPNTAVNAIERCSGHDGTYAMKSEFHDIAMKIAKPVINRVKKAEADVFSSDCPMAADHIASGLDDSSHVKSPISLLKQAYGL